MNENIIKFKRFWTVIGSGIVGIIAHYYGSKLLDYKDNLNDEVLQTARDQNITEILQRIINVENIISKTNEEVIKDADIFAPKDESVLKPFEGQISEALEVLESGIKSLDIGSDLMKESVLKNINISKFNQSIEKIDTAKESVLKAIDIIKNVKTNNNSNFGGESELTLFYKYLYTLSFWDKIDVLVIVIVFILTVIIIEYIILYYLLKKSRYT